MSELKITLFEGDLKDCLVNDEKMTIGLAKIRFGDWDALKDEKELRRRRFKGISHFTFDLKTEIKPEETKKKVTFAEKPVEDEFPSLNIEETLVKPEINQEEVNSEFIQCSGKTKSGKQCKKEALEGSKYCGMHKE